MKNFALTTFFLIVLFKHVTTREFQPLLVSGAIVEQIGHQTKLVEGILKMDVHFQAPDNLTEQLNDCQHHLMELQDATTQYGSLPWYHHQRGNPLPALINVVSQEINMLLTKIETVKSFDWINQTKTNRNTRGAFDFGGVILSNLFGLATDTDLKLVSKKMDVVGNAVKASNLAALKLVHDQAALTSHMDEMRKDINVISKKLQDMYHVNLLINKLVLAQVEMNRVEKFLDYLITLDQEIAELISGAQGNSLHILPKSLFPLKMLMQINTETEEKLQMKSVAPLNKHTLPYYLNAARIFPGKEMLSLILIIPYASDKTYDAYKFHPFPTFHKNFTQHRVILSFRLQYMLLSTELKTITHLTGDDFELCSHVFIPESTFVCFISHPLYNFPLTDSIELRPQRCQEAIVRKKDTSSCLFLPYVANDTVVKRLGRRVYLSSVAPLEAVVNCPAGNSQPTLKELTVLAPGCSFTSKGVSLNNYLEVHGDLLVPMSAGVLPEIDTLDFSSSFPNENSKVIPKFEFSANSEYIRNQIQKSETLLEKADAIPVHAPYIISSSALFICIVAVSIGLSIWCIQRKGGTQISIASPEAKNHEPMYQRLAKRFAKTNPKQRENREHDPEKSPRRLVAHTELLDRSPACLKVTEESCAIALKHLDDKTEGEVHFYSPRKSCPRRASLDSYDIEG